MVITISRETGSGGHTIGKLLAEKLGYDFYDKEIMAEVAKEMNLDEDLVSDNEENISDATYLDMVSGFIPFNRKDKVPYEEIKAVQDNLIKKIADRGNCVIVGRGADYILKDRQDVFNVFVHASMEHRIERAQRHDGITGQEKRIRRELEIKDKSRAMFYKYFSGREWGMVGNYNLSVDTTVFTKTQSMEIIVNAIDKLNGGQNNA